MRNLSFDEVTRIVRWVLYIGSILMNAIPVYMTVKYDHPPFLWGMVATLGLTGLLFLVFYFIRKTYKYED